MFLRAERFPKNDSHACGQNKVNNILKAEVALMSATFQAYLLSAEASRHSYKIVIRSSALLSKL